MICCPIQGSEDGCNDWHRSTVRRARKEHACCECSEPIKPGDRYEVYAIGWEGTAETYKTCLSCVEIRNHFACHGWLFGQVWNDLRENFFPTMKAGGPCMDGLSPQAKARLFEKRLAWMERAA